MAESIELTITAAPSLAIEMSVQIIDIDATLDIAGGANDEVSANSPSRADTAAMQVVVGGSSTAVEVHVETRLDPTLGWVAWETPFTLAGGDSTSRRIDIEGIPRIRVRAVNNDATAGNTATVRAVVVTQ